VLGIDIIIDHAFVVGVGQQVEQLVDDDQHFQIGQVAVLPGLPEHHVLDDLALRQVHHDVLVGMAAHAECAAASQLGEHGMARQPFERVPLVADAHFLPSAHRRRVLWGRAFDDHRAILVEDVVGAQRLAGPATREDIIVAVAVIKQAFGATPSGPSGHTALLSALANGRNATPPIVRRR